MMNDAQPPTAQPPGDAPRPVNLAAVAGGVILIALAAFSLYRWRNVAPADSAPPGAAPAAAADEVLTGTPIGAAVPIHLSPEASVLVERYRCVCGCKDPLAVCTCTLTPGSRDMKTYVQELVDQKKSPSEIDAAMVARYGQDVLLEPAASPTPAARR